MLEKISIIVPIYNGERWLEQCIDSLISQTYSNFEVLLIDDGSTDGSLRICSAYEKLDKRLRVIHKENAGVSAARNTGLENAYGRYVVFVDADDYVTPDILEKVDRRLSKKSTEPSASRESNLLWFGHYRVSAEGKKIEEIPVAMPDETKMIEVYASLIDGCSRNGLSGIFRSPWGKVYDLDVIKKYAIKFHEDLYLGEDAVFLLEYLSHVDGIEILDETGYYYRVQKNSMSNRYNYDAADQYIRQAESILKVINQKFPNEQILKDAMAIYYWRQFRMVVENGKQGVNLGKISRTTARRQAKNFYKNMQLYVEKAEDLSRVVKFIRTQDKLGTRIPFIMHYGLILLQDKRSGH